ncbi:hypothetical protein DPMN_194302 [Dreissena polymorpha]|uniref:Uncharacterized protein n=1 Tax=Dreissena polymorpha TaxID=45954 RepID=A0A9D3Y3G0_DREPO|nr:hypothetical protein DPMN_194302 [Dreissena polymorpha]
MICSTVGGAIVCVGVACPDEATEATMFCRDVFKNWFDPATASRVGVETEGEGKSMPY